MTETLATANPDVTMAYSRRKAEQIVSGLERPLNVHLIKLIGVLAPEETRRVWKREVLGWLSEIAAIRLKPDRKRLTRKALYEWLYVEPFEGAEAENVAGILEFKAPEYVATAEPAIIAAQLRALLERIAESLASGETPAALISGL